MSTPVKGDAVVVNVAQFGVLPDGSDATPGVLEALKHCHAQKHATLLFPQGRYAFHPDFAKELYLHVCNNDEGLKRIVFPLVDFKELTIDGQNSSFVFHGALNPFFISGSSSITLHNFSIDFSRSFHNEGIILAEAEAGLDLYIPEKFPYVVSGGLLRFTRQETAEDIVDSDNKDAPYGSNHILEFDSKKRETAFKAKDHFFGETGSYPAKEIGERKVRLLVPGITGTKGNTLVFGPNHRRHPAIVLHRSRDIELDSVTIHHAGGMGVIAQLCHNVHVNRCRVTPSEDRIASTTADATHFVNCSGTISLTENLFENQLDDATNIHGVYLQVVKILSQKELVVRWAHRQQHGFDFLDDGLNIEFVQADNLQTIDTGKVVQATALNKEYSQVLFAADIPSGLSIGDTIAADGNYPEVTIAGNTIRNNRARGILLNCRGKTLVKDNLFHTPGPAILFEGDASYWFEQGGVRNCVIRENTFENCLYGAWGRAVIDIQAGISSDRETSRYNRDLLVENNHFIRIRESPLLHAFCVDTLDWKNNRVEESKSYPALTKQGKAFNISHSCNVSIVDPHYTD